MLHARLRAAAGNAGIPSDYIALWDMAGDALDATGNYNMSLFGAVQSADHVDFDGTDDYGQTPRLAFNDNAFTIVTRVRFDAFTSQGVWIANSRSTVSGAGREWQLILFASGGTLPSISITNSGGTSYSAEWPTGVTTGVWYVIACRFTGSAVQIFDGDTLKQSTPTSGTMNTGSAHTQFAKRGWDNIFSAFGHQDLSRTIAYDRAVTDAELSEIVAFIEGA